ncbi:MAG: IPT/TIG domain-containing protein [Deltaproteobacteria bacterium]|nr:IPT/TIG domain-containing protein [Deltaproteobacteria bacterium]
MNRSIWFAIGTVCLFASSLFTACDSRSVDSPTVASVEPSAAQVKSVITINGSHFVDSYSQTVVQFTGGNAVVKDFISVTNSEIVIRVPNVGQTGPLSVKVQDEISNGVSFSVFGPWAYVGHGNANPLLTVIDSHVNESAESVEIRAEIGLEGAPEALAPTPEGDKTYVSLPSINTIVVLDAPNNTIAGVLQDGVGPAPSAMAATKQDKHKLFVANRGDRSVTVVDTLTNTVIATLTVSGDPDDGRTDWGTASVALDPSFQTCYVIFKDEGILRAYWVDSLQVRSENEFGPQPIRLLVLPNNSKVYSLNQASIEEGNETSGSLTTLLISEQRRFTDVTVGSNPTDMVAAASVQVIVANRSSNSVSVVNADGDVVVRTFADGEVGVEPAGVTLSGDNQFIYVASAGNGSVYVINREQLTVNKEIPVSSGITDIQYRDTGEGERLFVLNPVENTVTAITVEDDKDEVISSATIAEGALFMLVEELTTYPPSE